jgi:hypothetical protein
MSKEALIAGGFDYSEIHESYFRMKNEKYIRLMVTEKYVSKITKKEYPFDVYNNHGFGGIKKGFHDVPANEYPFEIVYKRNK